METGKISFTGKKVKRIFFSHAHVKLVVKLKETVVMKKAGVESQKVAEAQIMVACPVSQKNVLLSHKNGLFCCAVSKHEILFGKVTSGTYLLDKGTFYGTPDLNFSGS